MEIPVYVGYVGKNPSSVTGKPMIRLFSTIFKIALGSLITGVILTKLNLSAEQILLEVGMTPDKVMAILERWVTWAIPNLVLGSMVIVPVWLVVYLFRPPRG